MLPAMLDREVPLPLPTRPVIYIIKFNDDLHDDIKDIKTHLQVERESPVVQRHSA